MEGYKEDLAYIHDVGYGEFARNAAPALVRMLRLNGIHRGLVVDLGCGSGILARELLGAGYDVLGMDISPAMIRLARKTAPAARFVRASLLEAELPQCSAVTSIGECLNYCFDPANSQTAVHRLFGRIFKALLPGGMFIFDIAEPGGPAHRRGHWEGDDWAVLMEAREDTKRRILTREITTFRKIGRTYRRDRETHRLRLFHAAALADKLARLGFAVRFDKGYGRARLPEAHTALIACKPRNGP
jgi:SAM-dependent methyltransferase